MGEKSLPREAARSQPPSAFGGSSGTQPGCEPLGAWSTPEVAARPALACLQGRSPLNKVTPLRSSIPTSPTLGSPAPSPPYPAGQAPSSAGTRSTAEPQTSSPPAESPIPSSTGGWKQTYKLLILDSGG